MNSFASRHSPPRTRDGDGRDRDALPSNVPADPFEALRERRYRVLINAGIEDDMAWEVATYNAAETIRAKAIPVHDAIDTATEVYGE